MAGARVLRSGRKPFSAHRLCVYLHDWIDGRCIRPACRIPGVSAGIPAVFGGVRIKGNGIRLPCVRGHLYRGGVILRTHEEVIPRCDVRTRPSVVNAPRTAAGGVGPWLAATVGTVSLWVIDSDDFPN